MKPRTVRARWAGDPPLVGDVLRSVRRPRFFYVITRVSPMAPESGFQYRLEVERRPIGDPLPPGVRVYAWVWDSRGPRASSAASWPSERGAKRGRTAKSP